MHKIELESAVYEDKKRTLKIASKMKKTRHANAYNDSPRNIARIKNAFSPSFPPSLLLFVVALSFLLVELLEKIFARERFY